MVAPAAPGEFDAQDGMDRFVGEKVDGEFFERDETRGGIEGQREEETSESGNAEEGLKAYRRYRCSPHLDHAQQDAIFFHRLTLPIEHCQPRA